MLTADDPRPGAQAELLRILQKQHVEISRATAPFSVTRSRRAPALRRAAAAATRHNVARRRRATTERDESSSPPAATSCAWTSRTRASPTRCSTISTGRRTIRRRRRTTTPAGRSPKGSPCRRCASSIPRCSTSPMEKVSGDVRAPGGVTGDGSVFAINHNGDNALATLRYRSLGGHPGGRGAVHRGRQEVRARLVRHPQREPRRSRQGGARARASRRTPCRRPRVKMHPVRAARVADDAHLAQHADRRLVALRARSARHSVRLHQHPGRRAGRRI